MAQSKKRQTPKSTSDAESAEPTQSEQAKTGPLPQSPWSLAGMVIRIFEKRSEWLSLAILLVVVVGAVALIFSVAKDRAKSEFLDLSEKQIQVVKALYELQDTSAAALKKKTEELETAQADAENAKEDMIVAKQNLEKETDKVTQKEDELSQKEEELKRQEKLYAKEQAALIQNVEQFQIAKADNIKLAKAILWLAHSAGELETLATNWGELKPQEIYSIAERTREVYFASEEHPAVNWLRRFAEEPDLDNLGSLRKLAGIRQQELEEILKKDLGFKMWVKATFPSPIAKRMTEGKPTPIYFGVQDIAGNYGWQNVILIRGAWVKQGDDAVQWQAVDTTGYSLLALVTVPDVRDWYMDQDYVVARRFEKQDNIDIRKVPSVQKWPTASWVDRLLTLPMTSELAVGSYDTLSGKISECESLTYQELEKNERKIYQAAMENQDLEFAESVKMSKRVERYQPPTKEIRAAMQRVPEGVVQTLTELLRLSVQKKLTVNSPSVGPSIDPEVFGRIAALALKSPLSFRYTLKGFMSKEDLSVQQQTPEVREALIYEIYVVHSAYRTYVGKFSFVKASTAVPYGWLLTKYRDNMTTVYIYEPAWKDEI